MEEEENFLKVFKLVTGPGTECVRHIFDMLLPPATLNSTLNLHKYTTIRDLKLKRRINPSQDALLYPSSGAGATSITFDLSLMICLIRNLTTTSPPINGFDKQPLPSETSVGADIARIKFVRNLLAHADKNTMSNSDFSLHWSSLYDAIVRQGVLVLKKKCDDIKNLRLVNDVKIQDFSNQVADFKQIILAEISEMGERVSNVEKENMGIGERVSYVEDSITGVVDRVSTVENRVSGIDDRVTRIEDSVSTAVSRVSVVERDIVDLKKREYDQKIIPTHIQEQFQKWVEEWQKEDDKFVNTSASIHVMKCVAQKGCVSVIGNSGTGKTFTARHTALQMKRQGYLIVPVTDPRDLNYFQHERKTLFIIDDFCGRYTLNEIYFNDWRRVLEKIELLMNDKCFKMIVTCRQQVFLDEKFKFLSLFKTCVCDLSSPEFRLTSDEIDSLVETYASDIKDSLPQLSENIDFYPLLFSLYNKTKNKSTNVKNFFCHPFECYKDELDSLEIEGTKGKIKYCGLVLCVLFNNALRVNDLLGKTHHKAIIDKVLVECEAEGGPRKTLCKELDTLNGSFLVKSQEVYIIIHDKLFDFLAKYFGEKMMEIFIKCAHSDIIKERFLSETFITDAEAEFSINIPDTYIQMYIDRLISDWGKGEIHRVFTNRHMKSAEFRKTVFACFGKLSKGDQEKLVSIQSKESLDTPLHYLSIYGDVDQAKWMIENGAVANVVNIDSETALYIACENGHLDLLRFFIQFETEINTQTVKGWSPLHTACYNNRVNVVKELLKSDHPDIDVCDSEGQTSLYLACREGHVEVVRFLLNHSANISKANKIGWTALHTACDHNEIEVLKELLMSNQIDIDACDSEARTSLYLACDRGYADVVRLLLQHFANINKADENNWTPLHTACDNNDVEVVKELLKSDHIDIDACDFVDRTPLYLACREGHVEVVRLLLRHSANVKKANENGWTALHTSCVYNEVEVVKELLKYNQIDIEACNSDDRTSLYLACREGHVDVIRLLLQHSANVNRACEDKLTPLFIASYKNRKEAVTELLKSEQINIDVGIITGRNSLHLQRRESLANVVRLLLQHSDKLKWTPLQKACFYNNVEDVQELLKIEGTDIEACDDRGQTSLYLACERGNVEIVKLLLNLYANVNKFSDDGWTPFHTACYNNQVQVVEELLKSNQIDIDVTDSVGKTSLHLACKAGNVDVVRLLLQHSANINKPCDFGLTPFHTACYYDQKDVIRVLLMSDQIDIDVGFITGRNSLHFERRESHFNVVRLLLQHSDKLRWTPLQKACFSNKVEDVKELLKKKGNEIEVCDDRGQSCLYLACERGHVDIVKILLKQFANVNKANKDGWTPLHTASFNNQVEVVKELLKIDRIEIDFRDSRGETSFYLACSEGGVDIVRLLLQNKVEINKPNKNEWTPLHIACYYNKVEVIKELLARDQINVDACNALGRTSLHIACNDGHIDVVRLLLQHSANVNKPDLEGFTPLMTSCQNLRTEIVVELLNNKADVNVKMYDGDNAILSACRNRCSKITEILLQHGADANSCLPFKSAMELGIVVNSMRTIEKEFENWYHEIYRIFSADLKGYLFAKPVQYTFDLCAGSSCLHFASMIGLKNTVQILITHSANVNVAKEDGTTPLFFACEFGHIGVVKMLLAEGGKTELGRIDGIKPLDIAVANGHFDVASCLMKDGNMFSDIWVPDVSTMQN